MKYKLVREPKKLTLSLDKDIIRRAKTKKINLSRLLEDTLRKKLNVVKK